MHHSRIPLIVLTLALATSLASAVEPGRVVDLGLDGPLFQIRERDMMHLIQERAGQINPEMIRDKMSAAAKEYGRRLPGLPLVTERHRRTHEPVIVMQDEIRVPNGDVIAPAGTELRPLQHVNIKGRWVFLDTDQPLHMKWAKQILKEDPALKIVSVHGDPFQARKDLGTMVYLAYPTFLDRFGVERVPSVVVQSGQHFVIDEVLL